MPLRWTCPACGTGLDLSLVETSPRPGIVYRCSVCRLDLMLANNGERLIVPPLPPEREKPRRS